MIIPIKKRPKEYSERYVLRFLWWPQKWKDAYGDPCWIWWEWVMMRQYYINLQEFGWRWCYCKDSFVPGKKDVLTEDQWFEEYHCPMPKIKELF